MGVDPDGPTTEELTSVPLSPHGEPLSAYEEKVLAALEEEDRQHWMAHAAE